MLSNSLLPLALTIELAWLKLDEKDNKLSRRVVFSFANSCIS